MKVTEDIQYFHTFNYVWVGKCLKVGFYTALEHIRKVTEQEHILDALLRSVCVIQYMHSVLQICHRYWKGLYLVGGKCLMELKWFFFRF